MIRQERDAFVRYIDQTRDALVAYINDRQDASDAYTEALRAAVRVLALHVDALTALLVEKDVVSHDDLTARLQMDGARLAVEEALEPRLDELDRLLDDLDEGAS